MLGGGIRPDSETFSLLLRSCGRFSEERFGETVHCQILKTGFGSCVFLATGLLSYYAKVGELGSAQKMFDGLSVRDVVAHNAMIAALANAGRIGGARELFDGMVQKTSASWNSMITCYCRSGDMSLAVEMFERNPIKDVISWNAMIDGYCKLGQMDMALGLFERMGSAKNSVTWNTMISGYVHLREFQVATLLFQKMQVENVRFTEVTMVCLLSACAHLGAIEMGRWIHGYIKNHRIKVDVVLGNALIDMYYKCGRIDSSLEIFHSMPMKNIFCWNSIIVGLGMHGCGREALEAFHAMKKDTRIKPDGITFVGLLSACSHSGLVSEGKKCFLQMVDTYGVEPRIEHFGCMVDLLGRAGFLEEALGFINKMPMKPNAAVYGSLLHACKIHRDTELSEHVTQCLLELNPSDGGNYVFLSNMYASSNRWEDVERCRRIMVEKRVQKIPGCSSIEVDNVVHEFIAGDTSHPLFYQINSFLDEICMELRELGYEPDIKSVLHDIEHEEKENSVKYHSEKIAVAFGLMSIGGGKPIIVVKNLRVCYDCHEVLKLLAKLFGREIIVRDRNRFHHFRQGVCSCNDYW
ncbi:Pentatricopeptide repeat-containing protein [Zostera marina]|uniref:Pentatricopeptide repeat-containing protein n=1 Tax=Zostera marina TaxID=29655 RepID=A0A0K9Q641_ZOSMR|nr:Pentatricopeptide repeat-containing protein [Zostera marina]